MIIGYILRLYLLQICPLNPYSMSFISTFLTQFRAQHVKLVSRFIYFYSIITFTSPPTTINFIETCGKHVIWVGKNKILLIRHVLFPTTLCVWLSKSNKFHIPVSLDYRRSWRISDTLFYWRNLLLIFIHLYILIDLLSRHYYCSPLTESFFHVRFIHRGVWISCVQTTHLLG